MGDRPIPDSDIEMHWIFLTNVGFFPQYLGCTRNISLNLRFALSILLATWRQMRLTAESESESESAPAATQVLCERPHCKHHLQHQLAADYQGCRHRALFVV